MAQATVGTLDVQGLVPRTLGLAAAERTRRAIGEPLSDALGEAFAVLDDLDPGACWVIRSVHVHLDVPASEPDPARQAGRIAAGLAQGLAQVVRAGPSAEAVRFASRADHVAAYVRARVSGVGVGWVFDRFAAFESLPAPDALIAAARAVPVSLVEVVAALIGQHGWQPLLDRSPAESLVRLQGALATEVVDATPDAESASAALERWAEARVGVVDVRHARALAALRLIGVLAQGRDVTPGLVAAAVRAGDLAASPPTEHRVDKRGRHAEPSLAGGGAAGRERPTEPSRAGGPAPTSVDPGWLPSPGAAAFLLLPDLVELAVDHPVLAEPGPGAVVRAAVLAGVFGGSVALDDPALAIASGLDPLIEHDAWRGTLGGAIADAARELAADDILGRRHPTDAEHFAPLASVDPDLAAISAALFRRFAGHLPGFGHAGAGYLLPRVLPLGGRVAVNADLVEALLPRPPLGVLLALAGLDAFVCRPPWLDVPVAVGHEAES